PQRRTRATLEPRRPSCPGLDAVSLGERLHERDLLGAGVGVSSHRRSPRTRGVSVRLRCHQPPARGVVFAGLPLRMWRTAMMTLEPMTTMLRRPECETPLDEAQLAVAAFLARYSARTLEAYRHDLRGFFQWAADNHLVVLEATRPHIELYRAAMEERRLAPSTIDRRLSPVCGFYRFAHIDGRIPSNPAQYVRRPKVQPGEGHGMDCGELGTFSFTAERFDRDHAALAVLLGLNG